MITFFDPFSFFGGFGGGQRNARKKCKGKLIEMHITSLIMMGGCFDKMSNPNDMNISKSLKEEARDIFTQNLSGQNYTLEASIYKALIELYNEIANQQEQMKNYSKAIELLYKLLEVLDCLNGISGNLKEGGMGEKELEDKKTETYLKISNLYYRIKDYDKTIETLAKIANIKSDAGESTLSVRIILFNLKFFIKNKKK